MSIRILQGDCRDVLKTLSDGSVQTIVTSPPYFGLRDYGTATWEGGDPECVHSVGGQVQDNKAPGAISAGVRPGVDASRCRLCGAVRIDSQIGLEQTPAEYVEQLVGVFRECRRVLRDDGTLWLNLGDSYASSGGHSAQGASSVRVGRTNVDIQNAVRGFAGKTGGLKSKDLIGIPWRVAFALQADGWYLRQDIIWAKPNPMPESVLDRCTKAHEYIFLLSKSERYFFDADAISEPVEKGAAGSTFNRGKTGAHQLGRSSEAERIEKTSRNKRSVWTVGTQPFPEAHFATFPTSLIEPCILAGTSEAGCCSVCKAPLTRETERIDRGYDGSKYGANAVAATGGAVSGGTAKSTLLSSNGKLVGRRATVGWIPSCSCGADTIPCVVLDPFGGAGTTAMVADRLKRSAISIELNPDYVDMQRRRIEKDAGMFAQVAAE